MKKFELTDITKTEKVFDRTVTLYRIRALRDFGNVKSGDLGGWVAHEDNLSQYGDCWVYDEGIVCENGVILDQGIVSDRGRVSGHGVVSDSGVVSGHSCVSGYGRVSGCCGVFGDGEILKPEHVCVIGPIGITKDFITFYRTRSNQIAVDDGCFSSAINDFAQKVQKSYGYNKYGVAYKQAIALAKTLIELD